MSIKGKRVERTRNAGTMTNSMFFSMLRACLRQKSRWWKPIAACKAKARRAYKGSNKRQKYEYQCSICKQYFKDVDVAVDHIVPCGRLASFDDLPGFTERLFVEEEGLQVLCNQCHTLKGKEDNNKWKTSHLQEEKQDGLEVNPALLLPKEQQSQQKRSHTNKSQKTLKVSMKKSRRRMK